MRWWCIAVRLLFTARAEMWGYVTQICPREPQSVLPPPLAQSAQHADPGQRRRQAGGWMLNTGEVECQNIGGCVRLAQAVWDPDGARARNAKVALWGLVPWRFTKVNTDRRTARY